MSKCEDNLENSHLKAKIFFSQTWTPKPKPKYRLTGPNLETETENNKIWKPKPKPGCEEFGNRNRAVKIFETETETGKAWKSETGRFLVYGDIIIHLGKLFMFE